MDLHWNSSPSSPKSSLYHVKLVLCSVIITKKKKKRKRKKSKVKKKIKSIILVNIFYQIWVPFHTHGNNNFIENRKEKKKKKKKLKLSYTQLCVREREWEHTFIIYQYSGSNNKTCEAKGDSWSKEKSNEEHLEFFG